MRASLVLLAALASAFPARGDALDEAREHYERAKAQYGLGNYSKAADEYEKSFAAKSDPALLYNAAQAHRLAGNRPRALLLYQNLLRIYGRRMSNTAELTHHIDELKAEIENDQKIERAQPVVPIPSSEPAPAEKAPPTAAPESLVVAAPAPPTQRPLVKRAWFWGTVAGVVIVAGAGVALGLTLGSSTRDPTPSIGKARGN